MGVSLYLLILIGLLIFGAAIMIARANRVESDDLEINTEEWDCPECGFHVQMGDTCIYCDTEKN